MASTARHQKGGDVLYLDSADPKDVAAAAEMGFVKGVTTNPTLMQSHTTDPLEHFGRLLELFEAGPVMYQPTTDDAERAEAEVRAACELAPGRVVAKLPARLDHVRLAARLSREDVPCALTAVFSPGQAMLAHEAGCRWLIPYVDRASRDPSGGHDLVGRLAEVLRSLRSDARILAASVKSAGQALAAVEDGAHGVSAPMPVIKALAEHPSTEEAICGFAAAYSAPQRAGAEAEAARG